MKNRWHVAKTLYMSAVSVAGLYVLFTNRPVFKDLGEVLATLFLVGLVFLSETTPVPVPKGTGTVSVSSPLMFTIAATLGPAIGIWGVAIGTLRWRDVQGKVPLGIVLFNRGMLALSIHMFCLVYGGLGGRFGAFDLASGIVPLLLASLAHTLTNAFLFAVCIALAQKKHPLDAWNIDIKWSLPYMLALFPLGILMVLVVQQSGPYLLLLFYMPLMVSRFAFSRYIELRAAYQEMAGALSNAIDARDGYTRGHSERVAEYAAMLAKEMRFPEDAVEMVRYVGLLHDVGKIGIRDAIMKKQGTYTYDEYEEMKSHARMGAEMLEGMRFIGKGREWVRHHHERWDGHGFPDGLAGDDIPLEARIIACADAFDAMTTDRPYKEKMTFQAAREEIERCSGTQFDPVVARAMLRVVDRLIDRA